MVCTKIIKLVPTNAGIDKNLLQKISINIV
jgi:hypothetical protein